MAYLHDQKPPIIHWDIKPENILIVGDVYKIADFGWSSFNNEIRTTFCGTSEYLAPEMINGNLQNEKLDIWTVGILLYELISGKTPFNHQKAENNQRINQRVIEEQILKKEIGFLDKSSKFVNEIIKSML